MSEVIDPHEEVIWLQHAGQRLGLVPARGGSIAAWQWQRAPEASFDLWRPWDGTSTDPFRFASFAMVPWSNRISAGGFTQDGRFHPVRPNRVGEAYPIHGDAWLQPWTIGALQNDAAEMRIESHRFDGNPYDYEAVQSFRLVDGGLDQSLRVRHLGELPMPYGLGVHPWYQRTPKTTITAQVQGLWMSGADPLPIGHTQDIPDGWNLSTGVNANGADLIDNGYSGWAGDANIDWPEYGVRLRMSMPNFEQDGGASKHWCLLYRPPVGDAFCFEPITQPIDAFHLPGRPGLRVLERGKK